MKAIAAEYPSLMSGLRVITGRCLWGKTEWVSFYAVASLLHEQPIQAYPRKLVDEAMEIVS